MSITPPRIIRQEAGWVVANMQWSDEFSDFVPHTLFTPHFKTRYAADLVLKLMLREDNPTYFCMPSRRLYNEAKAYLIDRKEQLYLADKDCLIIVINCSTIAERKLRDLQSIPEQF